MKFNFDGLKKNRDQLVVGGLLQQPRQNLKLIIAVLLNNETLVDLEETQYSLINSFIREIFKFHPASLPTRH